MSIYSGDFSREFSRILQESNLTCYKISQFTGLDEGYLSRLKSGEKQNPSPETLMKISLALTHYIERVTTHDINQLFKATGRSIIND